MSKYTPFSYVIWIVLLVTGLHLFHSAEASESKKRFTNSLGMEFVYVKPGTFLMGSPVEDFHRNSDEIQHRVTLTKGFYIQTSEVTQEQWKTIMGVNPSQYSYCGPDCPVEMISWNEAKKFISKLNIKEKTNRYRLPTEAEWEYACRAGTDTHFYFGNSLYTTQANYNGNHPLPGDPRGRNLNRTVPVKSYPPNKFGIHDMHGNVYEWCEDWYGEYPPGHAIDPVGPKSGISKVCRGGGLSSYARRCRSANRTKHLPSYWSFYIGVRLVFTAEE